MSAQAFAIFALQISTMLLCTALGQAMRALHQPAVLGEMAGGILLGPTVFGALFPQAQAWLFTSDDGIGPVRSGVIKLGMLFFLFIVGLEINLGDLRRHGRQALSIGLLGSLVPLVAGLAAVYVWPDLWGPQASDHRLAYGLFIGAALANTANPVLARILYDLGLLDQPIGAMTMTATIIDDLLAWSVLGFVLGQFDASPTAGHAAPSAWLALAFFLVILLAGRLVFAPLLEIARRRLAWPTGFLSVVIVLVLLSGAASDALGLHAFLGPFLVGLALAPSLEQKHEAYAVIHHFALSFFVPVYFVSMALGVDFAARFDLLLVVVVLLVASISKLLSVFAAARSSGVESRTAWAIAAGMNARGATGIILASVGLDHGVIDERVYVALVVMALATSLVAGPAMKRLVRPICTTETPRRPEGNEPLG